MSTPTLSHNLSRCFPSSEVPWHDLGAIWPGSCDGKILRALDDGTARSVIVRLAPGYERSEQSSVAATVQGFVLSGAVRFGDVDLEDSGFFVVPTGQGLPNLVSSEGAELLLIFDDAKTAKPCLADAVILPAAASVAAIVPVIAGVELKGFERRVLWEDPDTGADTRLLTVPAGFEGKGPNWHPVHEEIFCLKGDIGPDDNRLMTPGTYLHNPAFGVHGYHEHSRGGATILEWHDGPWAVKFIP